MTKTYYDLGGRGHVRDQIEIESEAHKDLIDALNAKVAELNELLKKAYDRGDVVHAVGGVVSRSDGPALNFEIHKVINGTGTFSAVADIRELFGGYAEALAHAGAGAAVSARVAMKLNANLTIASTGQGISLGLAFGSFSIERR